MVSANLLDLTGGRPGILEIKCPHKFSPGGKYSGQEYGWSDPRDFFYYMCQVQGTMEVMDREWAHLYCWTPSRGSTVFHIQRDREFWALLYSMMDEFWHGHVAPAKMATRMGCPLPVRVGVSGELVGLGRGGVARYCGISCVSSSGWMLMHCLSCSVQYVTQLFQPSVDHSQFAELQRRAEE